MPFKTAGREGIYPQFGLAIRELSTIRRRKV